MKKLDKIYGKNKSLRVWLTVLFLFSAVANSSLFTFHFSLIKAQEISVMVKPVQGVLPPRAGQYIDDPGKFFTVQLTNNTDEAQYVHMGMHIDMTFPEEQVMVVTPYGHLPRQPLVVPPRQTKTLNPIEMRQLFTHFELDEIFIRDGLYNDYRQGIFGLLPEGRYRLYLQAYKWDPEVTSAGQLNLPDNGMCEFSVCYMAQAPTFITPVTTMDSDPLSLLSVSTVDVNNPGAQFTWTLPTLKCNPSLYPFEYDVKIVRLDDLMPDEAIERNPVEYQRLRLTTPELTIPSSYMTKMMEQTKQDSSTVYALQVTAHSTFQNANNLNYATASGNLNFSLIENDGRSPVLLFRLRNPLDVASTGADKPSDDKTDDDSEFGASVEAGDMELDGDTTLYVFEQPTLTSPQFPSAAARKVFVGDSIRAEWRKAWFAGGKGERQDTVNFEYTVRLYKGNSADTPEGIFTSKPVYTKKTTELTDTIKWDKLKDKVNEGDYLMLRVTAEPTNIKESIRMHGDSLNYKDFAMCEHVEVDYDCGVNTANVTNKTPLAEAPQKGTKVRIGDWTLEMESGVEQDKTTKALKGKGWISWTPGVLNLRVAVKFDKLMVNTDLVAFDGVCQTYPDPKGGSYLADDEKISSQDAVDALFSDWGLDQFFSSIDSDVADKVTDETKSLAEEYEFGKYYSYFKKGKSQWNKAKAGQPMDIYFPTELPDTIASLLPDDLSMQIASIQYSPRAAVMNLIGELVLPKTDVLKDKVLVFGAPRLCIQKDRFFPEDGTLALLTNFTIKDPDSDFDMTFKAPMEPLNPTDGCFLQWRDDSFDGLGIEVAMHIPGLDRVVDGEVQKDVAPICDLKATIENSWSDWMGTITMSPFQVRDLPGWTFTPGEVITYDHSYNHNDPNMPNLSKLHNTYDPSKVGAHVKRDWDTWQGLYIKDLGVGFPKWYVFGKDDKGLEIDVQDMLLDASGITCSIAATNILEGKTGSAGGWRFNIDKCQVDIVQNNFDNCTITGGFGVPLFGKKAEKKENDKAGVKTDKKGDDDVETDVKYTCEIRHLTDPTKSEDYYTYVQKRDGSGKAIEGQYEKVKHTRHEYDALNRYAYIFKCEQVGDLQMNCFVADLTLLQNQTYFLLEAEDQMVGGKMETKTEVELCMAGDITIAGANSANETIKSITKDLPIDLTLPGIHFSKLRLSNVEKFTLAYEEDETTGLRGKNAKAQKEWESKHGSRKILVKDDVLKLGDECFFNYGEWSLASEKKKIGPFSFSLDNFDFDFKGDQLSLGISGTVGLIGDKIEASAGISITSKLDMSGSSVSDWSLSNGKVRFDSAAIALDFSAIRLKGKLAVSDDASKKGYAGSLDIAITGLFEVNCEGGYYKSDESWRVSSDELSEMNADAKEANETLTEQEKKTYTWGYFKVAIKSTAGLRFDPLVINRISGGFYFNCRPTKGDDKDKFGGAPVGQYGMIGIAMGLGMNTSAGKETLNADLDLLVVYDRKNKCLSTFMFDGKVNAVGGIIKAECSLIYENVKNTAGKTMNRYLTLNITLEAGWDTSDVVANIAAINDNLKSIKGKLDKFQEEVDGVYKRVSEAPMTGLKQLSGDYHANDDGVAAEDDVVDNTEAGTGNEDMKVTAGKVKISLELMIRWVRDGQEYSTPKWHLYLGQPSKDKRCSFTFLKFGTKNKPLCWADFGADGYLCLGNELPDNGALPPIPEKIQEFLSGHKNANTDMGADLQKAERSRSKAVKNLLKEGNVDGGVMVGASIWGEVGLDLGLIYGSMSSMAGFDASIVHYGSNAVCVNSRSHMGKDGWYAMGQLYAFLEAELGLHIKIGKLIDSRIKLLYAGIGGVLELGLPNPSWAEGQLRVKISLLAGLVKLNKKFEFSAGDHCVPFLGNALDGFELFGDVSLGSDSLYEALYQPEFAISQYDAHRMTFTTNASLGGHFRLVDPSYQAELAKEVDVEEDSLLNHLSSRTYVFDVDQNLNRFGNKIGVRLIDLGTKATDIVKKKPGLSPEEFYEAMGGKDVKAALNSTLRGFTDGNEFVASAYQSREETVAETSIVMKSKDINSAESYPLNQSRSLVSHIGEILDNNQIKNYIGQTYDNVVKSRLVEANVSFREEKGTTFHLTDMNLEPGHSYALFLDGQAFEILDGERVWCDYYDSEGDEKFHYIKWQQDKVWFFRVKDYDEDKVVGDSLRNLEPYVALAYPSVNGTKVKSGSEGLTTAYIGDIMNPNIALNRDLRTSLSESKMKWVLTPYHGSDLGTPVEDAQTRDCKYEVNGNCYNLLPAKAFTRIKTFANEAKSAASSARTYDFENEVYRLQLQYTYKYQIPKGEPKREGDVGNLRDSTFCLVDLWLASAPHDVTVDGWSEKLDDNWMQTTNSAITGSVLPYSEPFVGARPTHSPSFAYQSMLDSHLNGNYPSTGPNSPDYTFGIHTDPADGPGTPAYRLADPFLYFSYLGCWTFIGDRKVDSYAFDDAYIPFASESLIYEYNGTVVNSEVLKNPKDNNGMLPARYAMYRTWDNWNYNDSNQPAYPLPMTLKNIGGPTVNNQDGKTATVTPLNVHKYKDYRYCVMDLANDFFAPYEVAQDLSKKLQTEAYNIWYDFSLAWDLKDNSNWGSFDANLNDFMKEYNNLHRGQYINITNRGFNVRVPYYQMPLIFGGCFANDASYMGTKLSYKNRTFDYSIDNSDMPYSERWKKGFPNLFFWRLMGTDKEAHGYMPCTFQTVAGPAANAYLTTDPPSYNKVAWDGFDARKALSLAYNFDALIYRVNAYDVSTGSYKVVANLGGLPCSKIVRLAGGKDDNLSQIYDELNSVSTTLENNYDTNRPQALWSEATRTLYLVCTSSKYEKEVGGKTQITFRTMPMDTIWYDDDVKDAVWRSTIKNRLEKVFIYDSFKEVDMRSLANWFMGCQRLSSISGIGNLNTAKVADMSGMFRDCRSLTELDLRAFNTEKVMTMNGMFAGCTNLKTLKLSSFDTKNVRDMTQMFSGCNSLTTLMLDAEKFNTAKVKNMDYMFARCDEMKKFDLKWLQSDSLKSTCHMFEGCKNLTHVYLNDFVAYDVTNTEGMFANCSSLKVIYLQEFIPQIVNSRGYYYSNMFTDVPDNLQAYINYDLVDLIKNQIPGQKSLTYSENVQAVHFTTGDTPTTEKHYLVFLNSSVKYSEKKNKTVKIGDTNLMGKVLDVWSGSDVLSSIPLRWSSIKSLINEVIIGPSFKQSPTYVVEWFNGFNNLTKIEGLKNLNTRKVRSFMNMFKGCSKLTDLSEVGYFQTDSATNMTSMFDGCTKLTSVSTSNWNTKNVESMRALFKGCRNLTKITLNRSFDTRNVTDMGEMFMNCVSLEQIDCYGNFNTEKVTTMASMFEACAALKNVKSLTSKFDGSSLTTMNAMFQGCSSLESIELPVFSTPKTVQFGYAFSKCTSLKLLNLSSLSSESLSQCVNMFQNLPYPCTIYLPYNISQKILDQLKSYDNLILLYPVKVLKTKITNKYRLTFISDEKTYKVGDKYNGEEIAAIWTGKDVYNAEYPGWSASSSSPEDIAGVTFAESFSQVLPTRTSRWFMGMSNLTSIQGLNYLNTSKVQDMSYMFYGCSKLKSLNLKNFQTLEVSDMRYMFCGCSSLASLDLSSFDTRRVSNMNSMFYDCSSLKNIDLSNFYTWNVTSMAGMFYGCSSLTELDLTTMDTQSVTTVGDMFSGDVSLGKLRLGQNFTLSSLQTNSRSTSTTTTRGTSSTTTNSRGTSSTTTTTRPSSSSNVNNKAFENVGSLAVIVPEAQLTTIRSKFIGSLGFVEGVTGEFYTSEPEPEAQAIWTEDNKTLTFYYGLKVGSRFRGNEATQVWRGTDVTASGSSYPKWITPCKGDVTTVVIDPSFTAVKPSTLAGWFLNFNYLETITGLKNLNTTEATSMRNMFQACYNLTSVDLSNFKASKVTTIEYMFNGCRSLTEIDLSSFGDMPAMKDDMTGLFLGCTKLRKIDMGSIRTTNVTKANRLFENCSSLRDLTLNYLGLFDKVSPKATDAFKGVKNLEVKAPKSWGSKTRTNFTNNLGFVEGTNGYVVDEAEIVTEAIWTEGNTTLTFARKRLYNVGETFNGQKVTAVWSENDVMRTSTTSGVAPKWVETVKDKLTKVVFDETFPDQPGTNTQYYPQSFSSWFDGCSKLTSVTGLKYARSERATTMSCMFRGCSSLTTLDMSEFKTPMVQYMGSMFEGCKKLKTINLSGMTTGNVISMASMFKNCSALTSIDLSGFSTSKVITMSDMFYGCSGLTSLKLSNFNTANVTNMSGMFQGCSGLTSLDIGGFDTKKVTTMSHMFFQCKSLTSIPTGDFFTANVTDMSHMFYSCEKLWSPAVKNFNTSVVKDMQWMFANCKAATTIDVSGFNTQYVENMTAMFQGCSNLTSLPLSSFRTASLTNMAQMFYNCTNLKSLDLSAGFKTDKVTSMKFIFANCTALTKLKVSHLFNTNKVTEKGNAFQSVRGITVEVPSSYKTTVTKYLTNLNFVEGTTGTITTY